MNKLYQVSDGGLRVLVMEGTKEECEQFYNAYDGVLIDENDFEWKLEIED